MELNILSELSKKLQISPDFIIREYWEMEILKKLADSAIGPALVFKGGTALRLSYNSPRFSEDLDFDICSGKKFSYSSFEKIIKDIIKSQPIFKLKDLAKKYNTYLAQIGIKDEAIKTAISIKIEISTRIARPAKYYEPRMLISPTTTTQVLINTAKLDEIEREKKAALKDRKQPRDLFDLWYISQLKRERWEIPENKISPAVIKRELNKFLPGNMRQIITNLYDSRKNIRKTK